MGDGAKSIPQSAFRAVRRSSLDCESEFFALGGVRGVMKKLESEGSKAESGTELKENKIYFLDSSELGHGTQAPAPMNRELADMPKSSWLSILDVLDSTEELQTSQSELIDSKQDEAHLVTADCSWVDQCTLASSSDRRVQQPQNYGHDNASSFYLAQERGSEISHRYNGVDDADLLVNFLNLEGGHPPRDAIGHPKSDRPSGSRGVNPLDAPRYSNQNSCEPAFESPTISSLPSSGSTWSLTDDFYHTNPADSFEMPPTPHYVQQYATSSPDLSRGTPSQDLRDAADPPFSSHSMWPPTVPWDPHRASAMHLVTEADMLAAACMAR
mmetsp:Transcript_30466/g.81124  ORF Transcript_30466/g.81124 Transcript_30466/m.81124 type:complete len:327 (-) Transcript_30466:1737-2717(-)